MLRAAGSAKTAPQTPEPEPSGEDLPNRSTSWTELLEVESEDEEVAEIMETLIDRVMEGCFRADIRNQMVPFTTNWMKNHLLQITEQHFLCRDEGDGADDEPPEDSEPPAAEPDAWAKGCVPLVTPSPPPRRPSHKWEEEVVRQETEPGVLRKRSTIPQPKVSSTLPTKKTNPKLAVATIDKYRHSFPPPKSEKKNDKVPMCAKPGRFLPPLPHSAEKQNLMPDKDKNENISPAVKCREPAPLNLPKRHKVIHKLDPESLPDHCVFPKYEIADSNSKTHKTRWRTSELRPAQHQPERTAPSPKPEVDVRPKRGTVTCPGALRLEALTLAEGATLTQSLDLTRTTAPPQTPPLKLRPIRPEPAPFEFSVDQFVMADPRVKPLPQT